MNPNPYPKVRQTSSSTASISEARLRELFWSVPESSVLLEEAEHRITSALHRLLTPEPVQLFDDIYENVAR